ncbi:hypothetical protein ARMGADRAFT_1040843 [Armillaria gallica]|uniref:Uncharacterized protein n=1 Tax=Armillaria gallica TaxID=47427 RepID=A0A2H3CLW0_ARMGA|nr:hypothetical protein ARMGADRAFT_1040843 [Armillaria gallica]
MEREGAWKGSKFMVTEVVDECDAYTGSSVCSLTQSRYLDSGCSYFAESSSRQAHHSGLTPHTDASTPTCALEERISDTDGGCGRDLAASQGPLADPSTLPSPSNAAF